MKISEIAKLCDKLEAQMNNASPEQKAKWAAEARTPMKYSPEDEASMEAVRKLGATRWERSPALTPAT